MSHNIIPLAHRILLILREKCDLSITDISRMTGTCRQTTSTRVRRLVEYGLIDAKRRKGLPPKYALHLTNKGRQVALFLSELEGFRIENAVAAKKKNAIMVKMTKPATRGFRLRLKELLS